MNTPFTQTGFPRVKSSQVGLLLFSAFLLCLTVNAQAQTIAWQEDWESPDAQDNWYADFGYWEIGVPTSGPATNSLGWRAHQGTNVAATVLNGNYTDDRQSRLISSVVQIPPAIQNPRLRFWHWWHFNYDDDYGQVQISTNNGASWQALSPEYGYSAPDYQSHSDLQWTRAWLDLTPYAGKTVRLGLFFHSHNWSGNGGTADVSSGWYVDEMTIESGPVSGLTTLESFEDAVASEGWNADFGVWEIGAPTSGPGSAHSGSNCLATVLSGNYYDDRSSRISSQPFVVPPTETNPRLRFWHWWHFNYDDDYGQVQISTNNGASWQALSPKYGYAPPDYQSSSPWTQSPPFDLAPYAGQSVRIGFYFHSRNWSGNGGAADVAPGWYVDEVRLVHDFAAMLLDSPNVQTQANACISLGIASAAPVTSVSFILHASAGALNNLSLNTTGCWSVATITPQSDSEWLVSLQSSCSTAQMGVQTIGTICFTAHSSQSTFVPLTITDLVVSPNQTAHAFGGRTVVVANESLLEAWLDGSRRRMVTLYGKPGTAYEISYATELNADPLMTNWIAAWTNTIPAGLGTAIPLTGTASNAPVVFLRAKEL